MSKKQLRSRLENFFSDLAGDENVSSQPPPAGEISRSAGSETAPMVESDDKEPMYKRLPMFAGWSWESDIELKYTFCGPEINDVLNIDPRQCIGKSLLSYAVHPDAKAKLAAAFKEEIFPVEVVVNFVDISGKPVPARVHILSAVETEDGFAGLKGYTQRIQDFSTPVEAAAPSPSTEHSPPPPKTLSQKDKAGSKLFKPVPFRQGYSLEKETLQNATQIWTGAGERGLANHEIALDNATSEDPAVIAVPLQIQGVGDLLIEIVDDANQREWSEDDRLLVMEVAAQLALALDNAQLYLSVQQELSERIRAEQATLRRNNDLAALNQIGQQFGRLATRNEIYTLLSGMIGEVLDSSDLYICSYSTNPDTIEFPLCRRNNESIEMPSQPFGKGIPEYVILSRSPLLITNRCAAVLVEKGIALPNPVPASLLAIPMLAGERVIGAIVVQDFQKEGAFDSLHAELLSTAASQATTALENTALFQQMQAALEAIENRERYQSSLARSAAVLTEFGAKSLPEVLKLLGQAAQCSRVYFARLQEGERGTYWSSAAEWIDPAVAYLFDKTRTLKIPTAAYAHWTKELREKGWAITQVTQGPTPETEFLTHQHIHTILLLAVPGKSLIPGFIAFEEFANQRSWQSEEINALRVAADAISNTFIREGLLDQLQVTLDETEGLYKASNRLALANDMQEMVLAILSGVRVPEINRATLILFTYDSYGKLSQMTVKANWYSGRGVPPPPVGKEYLRAKYEHFFQSTSPLFIEDILNAQMEKELQDTLLQQNTRSLAVLPMWIGKRQIGVLLLQAETRHQFSGRETRTFPPLVDQMAIAVENQRLFDQTQIALAETELLYNVSNQIAQSSEAQDMLALVVETLLPAGADRASLILFNSSPNGDVLDIEITGFQDAKGTYTPMDLHLPVASLPLVKSLTDEPLVIEDISRSALDQVSQKTLKQLKITACCLMPLRTSGRLIGLLNTSAQLPTEFSQEDIHLLRIAGNGIAVALEKQRLLRQAQRRALELQTASEIARDTASTLSLDLLLKRIVSMLSERFGFYHASIFLMDENSSMAIIREATGEAGQEMKQNGHRWAVGSRSVVGTVTATGESTILNDVDQSSIFIPNSLLYETRSEMGLPLKLGDKIIGALDLQSREVNTFNQDDSIVLQILADQIAIAIENAQAYELSQKAIEDMKEIDRVKSQFLANMSHELRTPLNSIIGFSRVILKGIDGPITDTQTQDLTAIYNSGQHLLSLINDILDLSKIEAGKMELSFSDVSVPDLINSAMSTAVGLVKDKTIQLNTIIPETIPLIQADSTRIRQVLINLLSNAAKFTDEGTITVEAQLVNGLKGEKDVMITVTDSGPGIALEDQAKLFLPFSQVDDSPTRKTGGTGLGLSICRSLIDMHQGQIGLLHSEVGKGSTFFFTVPTVPHEHGMHSVDRPAESSMILAIDDDPRVINLYERYLKPHGYTVHSLTDPKQAVNRAIEIQPFAITLDIMMPEKDGWQVMRELKNHPKTRDIPIIICSILENQNKGFSMGAADYLVKPFLQEDIINAMGKLNQDRSIRNVLIIDDDEESRRLVQRMFETDHRYQISTAQGGIEGWQAIQSSHPDAVILDLFMPDMNGFMILENLRATPALRHIPVIIITGANLTPEQHRQLTDFGQGLLLKGYLREKELLVLVEEALRKFHTTEFTDKQ